MVEVRGVPRPTRGRRKVLERRNPGWKRSGEETAEGLDMLGRWGEAPQWRPREMAERLD